MQAQKHRGLLWQLPQVFGKTRSRNCQRDMDTNTRLLLKILEREILVNPAFYAYRRDNGQRGALVLGVVVGEIYGAIRCSRLHVLKCVGIVSEVYLKTRSFFLGGAGN